MNNGEICDRCKSPGSSILPLETVDSRLDQKTKDGQVAQRSDLPHLVGLFNGLLCLSCLDEAKEELKNLRMSQLEWANKWGRHMKRRGEHPDDKVQDFYCVTSQMANLAASALDKATTEASV